MTEDPSLPAIERDFDAIEAAVMQTERGRWFLAEYGRRNRVADTQLLLSAISRLGEAVGEPGAPRSGVATPEPAEDGCPELERALGTARTALAIDPFDATLPLSRLFGRMLRVSRSAATDMLDAVERVQEAAWNLREAGADPVHCEELESCAARILQAAAEGTVTEARGNAVRDAILAVEERLDAMRRNRLGLPEPDPASEPDADGGGEPADRPEPVPTASDPVADAVQAIPPSLAAIDAIDFRQRLKLFT